MTLKSLQNRKERRYAGLLEQQIFLLNLLLRALSNILVNDFMTKLLSYSILAQIRWILSYQSSILTFLGKDKQILACTCILQLLSRRLLLQFKRSLLFHFFSTLDYFKPIWSRLSLLSYQSLKFHLLKLILSIEVLEKLIWAFDLSSTKIRSLGWVKPREVCYL